MIPPEIMKAAKEFAVMQTISESWLNNGPSSLTRDLPGDWRERMQILYQRKALNFWTLDRTDLIRTKVWAMCDRMRDLGDLIDMAPSDSEISVAAEWVKQLDTNPNWPDHVETMVGVLRRRLGQMIRQSMAFFERVDSDSLNPNPGQRWRFKVVRPTI